MAKKKNQHVVPKVHLKQFTTTQRPGHPSDVPVSPFVWLIPKDLEGEPVARSPRNAMVATRPYNVAGDDLEAPWLEEALGRIEGLYGGIVEDLLAGEQVGIHEWVILGLFVGAQYARTPSSIRHWQATLDDVQHLHRQAERAHTGGERLSDQLFAAGPDMSRLQVPDRIAAYAKVVGEGGWLLRSDAPMPFITSDTPVAHHFVHVDELAGTGLPASWLNPRVTGADRAFISVCPLSPVLAFISSPLLLPPTESAYRRTANIRVVLGVNEMVRHAADATLISNVPAPYGNLREQILDLGKAHASQYAATPYKVSIYTRRSRGLFGATTVEHRRGDNPLQNQIRFRTPDVGKLRDLAEDRWVEEVEVSGSDNSRSGMRQAVFTSVATSPDEETVIQQDLARWPDPSALEVS